jgi:hypothetical protein
MDGRADKRLMSEPHAYCDTSGKIKYSTSAMATRAKDGMRNRGRMHKGKSKKSLDVFRCPFCGAFHVGNKVGHRHE